MEDVGFFKTEREKSRTFSPSPGEKNPRLLKNPGKLFGQFVLLPV